jgi:tetratricopeptide (TPR) repeat protein
MENFPLPYDELMQRWLDFNYVYLVIYPPEREAELQALLGPHADPAYNLQHAVEVAREDIAALSGRDQFFAWYNLGSSLVKLEDYAGAAQAYDEAFALYAGMSEHERPWRMLWYQAGPYAAYYHTGRHNDVINLADTTLSIFGKPILEEALYWRGLAKEALGDLEGARSDLQKAYELNPNSTPAGEELQRLAGGS